MHTSRANTSTSEVPPHKLQNRSKPYLFVTLYPYMHTRNILALNPGSYLVNSITTASEGEPHPQSRRPGYTWYQKTPTMRNSRIFCETVGYPQSSIEYSGSPTAPLLGAKTRQLPNGFRHILPDKTASAKSYRHHETVAETAVRSSTTHATAVSNSITKNCQCRNGNPYFHHEKMAR